MNIIKDNKNFLLVFFVLVISKLVFFGIPISITIDRPIEVNHRCNKFDIRHEGNIAYPLHVKVN